MSDFSVGLALVLYHEGVYSDDPGDPGGETKYGISLRFLRGFTDEDGDGWLDGDLDKDGDVDGDDIRALDRDEAANIYRAQWWDRYGYERIHDTAIAAKLLDLAVNMGQGQAVKILQRALGGLAVDGILGPVTVEAINAATTWKLLAEFRFRAVQFYLILGERQPGFLYGWLRRACA